MVFHKIIHKKMDNLSLIYARNSVLIFNVFFAVSDFQFYELLSKLNCRLNFFYKHNIFLNGFQLTGSIMMAISCIIYSEYLRYEYLTGILKYSMSMNEYVYSWLCLNFYHSNKFQTIFRRSSFLDGSSTFDMCRHICIPNSNTL